MIINYIHSLSLYSCTYFLQLPQIAQKSKIVREKMDGDPSWKKVGEITRKKAERSGKNGKKRATEQMAWRD